ncbi:MAG: imidazole glycerol phosphate synthase subunit HisF [Promicromonosporaceae bacterium]|nr:imidazole glycerol phosphate synthase subunit HisF [Promicromonosporaceae bacterium]
MVETIRIVPCLDVNAGRVVKGVNFVDLRDAGDPLELALHYQAEGADELTLLDISATTEGRQTTIDTVRRITEQLAIPLTVGGGVRSVEDVDRLLWAGAARVGVNSAAIADPTLLGRIAERFGSQILVLAVDARRAVDGAIASGYEVTSHGGQRGTGLDAVEWAAQGAAAGAGEILLTSMDADGTKDGFDLDLLCAVRERVEVPLVASGGAGTLAHFVSGAQAGANAVLAASVFHFQELTIRQVKEALRDAGFEVR